MIRPRLIPLVLKQLVRQRARTGLTVAGVAVAMFLFVAIQALQEGVHRATRAAADETVLVVYRANRYCPAASRLPEHYLDRIRRVPGVASAMPVKIVVNNCRASLDVVTFRGVPPEALTGDGAVSAEWTLLSGSLERWCSRSDAALVGELLASRRGLKVGQSFDAAGVTVHVAGIFRSPRVQDQNVAYVRLDYLQRATERGGGVGSVTQFDVRVDDPARLDEVARAIDEEFRADADPTTTRPEQAFVAQAAGDVVQIVRFTRLLGWGCLAAVVALVANAMVLSVQGRVAELAVLQTLGYRPGLVARLIVCEGVLMGLGGGVIGASAALVMLRLGHVSLSQEGLSITVPASPGMFGLGLALAAVAGTLASLTPAWQASRQEIAACFRAV